MHITISQQVKCETCGYARTDADTIRSKRCPFCGVQPLVRRGLDGTEIQPDYIVPIRIDRNVLDERLKAVLPKYASTYRIRESTIQRVLRAPLYVPIWTFDIAVDPDGSGPQKPQHSKQWRVALKLPIAPVFDKLVDVGVSSVTFDERYIEQVPMIVPQIGYRSAAKQVLLGVQGDLDDRGLSATRESGIIGEVGMNTHMLLVPVWLVTLVEGSHLYHLVVDGSNGQVHTSKPRQRG